VWEFVGRLARKAVYKTPSDINNIVQEAALISSREGKDAIDYRDLMDAMDRIDLGFKHKIKMTERQRRMTAYHESGHAVVMYYLHPDHDVSYATIIKRGGALGHVQHMPLEELYTHDEEFLLAQIKTAIAGYVAEKIKFGVTTDGVAQDFQHAMAVAHAMVWKYGMGRNGFLGDFSAVPKEQISDDIRRRLNDETHELFKESVKEVESLLEREREVFERFGQELLEKEELDYDQIAEIFVRYGTKTPRRLRPTSDVKEAAVGD